MYDTSPYKSVIRLTVTVTIQVLSILAVTTVIPKPVVVVLFRETTNKPIPADTVTVMNNASYRLITVSWMTLSKPS